MRAQSGLYSKHNVNHWKMFKQMQNLLWRTRFHFLNFTYISKINYLILFLVLTLEANKIKGMFRFPPDDSDTTVQL